MARSLSLLLALAASLCLPQLALAFNVYTVGGDAACPYANIQDAIDAAAGNPGEDYVFIATNGAYGNQHLVVANQDVDIIGGFPDCSQLGDPGSVQTTIAGTSGHSVFEIEGNSHVFVRNLFIRGGDLDGDHSGGGIYFGGQGGLELANTTVSLNTAGYGGGIDVNGSSGPATLRLDADTLVLNNTASVSGGGIRIEGDTRLYVLQPNTLIGFNHAPNGYGGGIEVLGPARADIGSPGYNGSAVIQFN
ncbi:MAG: hypothetical protein WCE70_06260, partial [Rhodanobacteraceae bacterium]